MGLSKAESTVVDRSKPTSDCVLLGKSEKLFALTGKTDNNQNIAASKIPELHKFVLALLSSTMSMGPFGSASRLIGDVKPWQLDSERRAGYRNARNRT
jgi:hypothetical protein